VCQKVDQELNLRGGGGALHVEMDILQYVQEVGISGNKNRGKAFQAGRKYGRCEQAHDALHQSGLA
jgi:hypothetical protein